MKNKEGKSRGRPRGLPTKAFTFVLPVETNAILRVYCKMTGRRLSEVINQAVSEYLEAEDNPALP